MNQGKEDKSGERRAGDRREGSDSKLPPEQERRKSERRGGDGEPEPDA